MIFVMNGDLKVNYINKKGCDMLGKKKVTSWIKISLWYFFRRIKEMMLEMGKVAFERVELRLDSLIQNLYTFYVDGKNENAEITMIVDTVDRMRFP